MSPVKSPWFPWFPRDFLADEPVILMTLEQEGAYRRLLDHQWLHGSIPADIRQLAVICKGIPAARMRSVWSAVSCCFDTASGDGRLVNARLERVRAAAEEHRDRQSQNGSKGAAKRWRKDGEANGVAIEVPMAKNSSALPLPIPDNYNSTATGVRGWGEFFNEVPETYRESVHGAITAANNPDALRRELVSLREAITGGPAYTPAQIGQALHELAVAGSRVTSAGLRAFCRRIAQGDRTTAPASTEGPAERVLRIAAAQDVAA